MRDVDPTPRDVAPTSRSFGELLGDAVNHVSSLVRNEIDLAKAEARDAARSAVAGLVLIVLAVIIAICALNVLTAALVAAIAAWFEISAGWSSLIVGVAYLVVGLILVLVARSKLNPSNLTPSRTVRNVERDAQLLKEKTYG